MGNVVAGEALRLAGTNQVVNTYIAMQGAVPAHAYDPTATPRTFSFDDGTPNRYAEYYTNGASCYFNGSAGARTYVNFYNANDYALSANSWQVDQNYKPDLNYSFAGTNFYRGSVLGGTPIFFPTDTYEIFSYIIEARSYALGAQPNVGGPFQKNGTPQQVNLPDIWPPDPSNNNYGNHIWHSAQFRSDNVQRWQFWDSVLGNFGILR